MAPGDEEKILGMVLKRLRGRHAANSDVEQQFIQAELLLIVFVLRPKDPMSFGRIAFSELLGEGIDPVSRPLPVLILPTIGLDVATARIVPSIQDDLTDVVAMNWHVHYPFKLCRWERIAPAPDWRRPLCVPETCRLIAASCRKTYHNPRQAWAMVSADIEFEALVDPQGVVAVIGE
ncbi:MAG: hypothetical protein OXU19_09575, partial [bacterium]|nr:hypothetical protein [bacterium]